MKLKPLQQWLCDSCARVIEKPDDGWVYWSRDAVADGRKVFGFHIVHQFTASPRRHGLARDERPDLSCYPARIQLDMPLPTMIGPRGIVEFLSFMDVGEYHDRDARELVSVKDVRNWAETFRRLHLPYYEEARLYFERARRDGEIDGINEIALYTESVLESLVERYGEE